MGFYDLPKEERVKLVKTMRTEIESNIENSKIDNILNYSSDDDTYIRKNCYQILAKLYEEQKGLRNFILKLVNDLLKDKREKVRQTMVNTLGEIGKFDAENILGLLEKALDDPHHSVRNAVVGSLKKMGEKNPKPTLEFIQKFLTHDDPEIRREMVHGMELRGRTHPEDILPLLERVQNEKNKRVRKIIIHVIAQISYKKGCLEKVIPVLKNWKNQSLVEDALKDILVVHEQYQKFSMRSYDEASEYIEKFFKKIE